VRLIHSTKVNLSVKGIFRVFSHYFRVLAMAALSITGQLNVASLQKKFLSEFELNIRIYDGRSQASPDITLSKARRHKS